MRNIAGRLRSPVQAMPRQSMGKHAAHDGLGCQRWGTQLRYGLQASGGGGGQIDVEPRFAWSQVTCSRGLEPRWCHLGFLCWDRGTCRPAPEVKVASV
ncbi:uncharacterized protein PG986_013054 [Apiospora aurea]|uniref:Uncharacterized protein n=1 Tax=Apiospora aurea TaxID=335848 RepID=A0ABR1Q2Y5_9PEZI